MEKTKKKKIAFQIFAILLIIIFSFAITPVTLQNDTFYTVKIGELISKNGIDMQDHFSWHENLPYTYPHWGYDLIMYGIYNCSGFAGIYISTVILACILGIAIYIMNCKVSKNKNISLVVTLLVMYLLKDYIAARAQLVTFILFTLTIIFIEQFLETKKKRYLAYLLIIPILIANLHVAVWPFYFILFMPYIAEFMMYHIRNIDFIYYLKIFYRKIQLRICKEENKTKIKEKIELLNKQREKRKIKIQEKRQKPYKIITTNNKCIKWLIVVVILAAFSGLLTPLKDVPYTYLVKTMQGNTTENINEHLPLTLIDNKGIMIAFTAFLVILILTDTKIKLRDFLMLGGLVLLSFMSRRQTSMFVIICSPIFSKLIADIVIKCNLRQYKIYKIFNEKVIEFLLTMIVVLRQYIYVM